MWAKSWGLGCDPGCAFCFCFCNGFKTFPKNPKQKLFDPSPTKMTNPCAKIMRPSGQVFNVLADKGIDKVIQAIFNNAHKSHTKFCVVLVDYHNVVHWSPGLKSSNGDSLPACIVHAIEKPDLQTHKHSQPFSVGWLRTTEAHMKAFLDRFEAQTGIVVENYCHGTGNITEVENEDNIICKDAAYIEMVVDLENSYAGGGRRSVRVDSEPEELENVENLVSCCCICMPQNI